MGDGIVDPLHQGDRGSGGARGTSRGTQEWTGQWPEQHEMTMTGRSRQILLGLVSARIIV